MDTLLLLIKTFNQRHTLPAMLDDVVERLCCTLLPIRRCLRRGRIDLKDISSPFSINHDINTTKMQARHIESLYSNLNDLERPLRPTDIVEPSTLSDIPCNLIG